jgi:predicted metalloprotease with PDZ domain
MRNILFIYLLFTFSLSFLSAQTLPVMRSHQKAIHFREDGKENEWTITPELKPDTWQVQCGNKKVKVVFYSDCDSLSFFVKKGQKVQFYILLNEKDSALTELVGLGMPKKQHFEYKISPIFEQKRLKTLEVNFSFKGDKSGVTELNYPDAHWGDKGLQRGLVFVESPQKEVKIQLDYQNNKVIIKHLPSQKLHIRYQIAQTFNDSITGKKGHLPLIQPSYFHLMDNTFLMYPLSADYSEIKHNFEVKWEGFPSNWLIMNSFGSKEKKQKIASTLQDFQHGVWLGGDFRKYTIKVKGKTVNVAIRGNWLFEKEKEFIAILEKTIPQQRKFWNDYQDKYFIISVLPTYGEWTEESKQFGILGTGLTNSFACFVTNNGGLAEKWDGVKYVFNHELMHNWIGGKIQNSGLETLDYWFSEGFTDYFCYKNMLSADIITETQWLEKMNEIYQIYQLSPVKNMPNDSITDHNFWHNLNYEKLPYRRGLLFALALDMRIKTISQNTYSLNNVMWDLLKYCESRKMPFNRAIFLDLVKKYGQTDAQDFFNAHIIKGEDFDFTKIPLLPCLQIDVSEKVAKWKFVGENVKAEIVK